MVDHKILFIILYFISLKELMLLSKTPVRIEIGGGATDVEPYTSDYNGFVLNVTIDKYFRTILSEREDKTLNVYFNDSFTLYKYERIEEMELKEASKDLIKAILYYLKPKIGLDVYVHGEPPKKAGLGASASLSVSLIAAVMALEKEKIILNQIAEKAFAVEDEILKNPGGRQDQYAAVYGGFNEMTFLGGNQVIIKPLKISKSFKNLIEESLILYYTGVQHTSGNLVGKQVDSYLKNKKQAKSYLDELKNIAYCMRDSLLSEEFEEFGQLITKDWKVKSEFNPMLTTEFMKDLNKIVMKKGGIGGRVCGAGGGGCFLWLANPKDKTSILESIRPKKGKIIDFKFEDKGLNTIFI